MGFSYFLFFPIERTDRSFPAEKKEKKEIIFIFFFSCWFLSYCCVVSTSHAINVVCTVSPVGAVGAAWCRHSTCSPKSQSQGPPYLHAIKSLWWKTRPPQLFVSAHCWARAPLFFYLSSFVTHSRVYDMHAETALLRVSFVTLYSFHHHHHHHHLSIETFFLFFRSSSFLFGLSYPHILVMIQWGKQNGSAGNFIRLKNKRRRRLFCSACQMGIGMSL